MEEMREKMEASHQRAAEEWKQGVGDPVRGDNKGWVTQ